MSASRKCWLMWFGALLAELERSRDDFDSARSALMFEREQAQRLAAQQVAS